MKTINTIHALTAVGIALVVAGCEPQRPQDASDKPMVSPPSSEPAKPEPARVTPEPLPQTPQAMQTPATGTKDQSVAAVEKRLKDLDTQINKLGEKIEPADEYAKTALNGLHDLHAKADAKFNEVKQATLETWMELKPQLEVAMSDLEKAYADLKSRIIT